MPAFGYFGPVGRAAARIRIPTPRDPAKNLKEHGNNWIAIIKEYEERQKTGDGKPWVKHDVDYSQIDFFMQAKIDAWKKDPVHVDEDTKEMTAVEVVKRNKAHLGTCVLATVHCPGWFLSWQQSIADILLNAARTCKFQVLHSLKGGPMCDCEILYTLALAQELGFKVTAPRILDGKTGCVLDPSSDAAKTDYGNVFFDLELERPGHKKLIVQIRSHHDIDRMSHAGALPGMLPMKDNQRSPNLDRVAVISAPVTTIDGSTRVDEELNRKLVGCLEKLEELSARDGFERSKWPNEVRELDNFDSKA